MTMVERRDLHDLEALGGGDDRGVDGPKWQVVVAGDELRHPQQIGRVHGLEREAARCKVAKEAHLGLPAETRGKQVDDLGDDEGRDEQWAAVALQQLPTGQMVGIVSVDVGVQRTRVDDQRDRATSAAIMSSIRSEMSVCPL